VLDPSRDLRSVVQRMRLMVAKALLLSVDDSSRIQLTKVSGLSGEIYDRVERLQNYGFSSVPPVGSESLTFEVGGSQDHLVTTFCDSSTLRPTGSNPGESLQWTQYGHRVHCKADGSLSVHAPVGPVSITTNTCGVELNAGRVTINGDVTVTGTLTCNGAASFASTLAVAGKLTCQAIIQGALVIAGLVAGTTVSLLTHVHASSGAPPTPGT